MADAELDAHRTLVVDCNAYLEDPKQAANRLGTTAVLNCVTQRLDPEKALFISSNGFISFPRVNEAMFSFPNQVKSTGMLN